MDPHSHWHLLQSQFWQLFTCGLMFPRYKFVVDGSPTSWEPGAESSKTVETEKKELFPTAVWQENMHYVRSKLKVCTTTILSQNYHWTDGFSLKNHPLKEAEKQYKFCFRAQVDKGGGVRTRAWWTSAGKSSFGPCPNTGQSCSLRTLTWTSSLWGQERLKTTDATLQLVSFVPFFLYSAGSDTECSQALVFKFDLNNSIKHILHISQVFCIEFQSLV